MRLIPCTRECETCELEVGEWCFGYGTIPSNVLLQREMTKGGFDAESLSMLSGVSESSIRRMLDGDLIGSLDSWVALAKTLGVNLDRLVQVRDFADW